MINRNSVTIENATIMYSKTSPNFAGKAHDFNVAGNRNFCMFIEDSDLAISMKDAGWDVRRLEPREDHPEDTGKYFIPVTVKYKDRYGNPVKNPPQVYIVKSNGKAVPISENAVGTLDNKQIKYIDIILSPSTKDDGTYKAYANTIYVVVEENRLSEKYALEEVPEDDLAPGDDPFNM